MAVHSRRLYHIDATVLLLGFEGAGKRTLGIIASVAFKRQYIDFNRFFLRDVGCTPNEYMVCYGTADYNETISKVIQNLLNTHSQKCIIGGLPQANLRSQKEIIESFATTNPVIYIRRASRELDIFSKTKSDNAERLFSVLHAFYRCCSNVDYLNLSQASVQDLTPDSGTLKLKDVEIDFIRFFRRIFGLVSPLSQAREPFSSDYTYALQLPLERLSATFEYSELECGADAINLIIRAHDARTDLGDRLVFAMASLRRRTNMPVILDIEHDGLDSVTYLALLKLGLRAIPDALTVNLAGQQNDMDSIYAIKGSIKLIGTHHVTESWTAFQESSSFFRLQTVAARLSVHALRISAYAQSRDDNLECFAFAQLMKRLYKIPVIAYNVGDHGRTSICFNRILSPVVVSSEQGLTTVQARSALHLSFMLEPLKFCIFGSSISYSLSPAMHNAGFKVCGLPHVYQIHQSSNFDDIREFLANPCYGGVTVTMPFKTQVLPLLDYVSPEAQKIGAVNTVVVDSTRGTVLRGYNTDHIGIQRCFSKHISPANSIRATTTALIIGAGAMARAAIYALKTLGVRNVCIWNRTIEKANYLVTQNTSEDCKLHVLSSMDSPWPSQLAQPTMIISSIPAHSVNGIQPHTLNIPNSWLCSPSGGTFLEIKLAYKPVTTRLIKQMQMTSGWIVVDGLRILLEQGIAQFELFTGVPAPVNVMRNALKMQFAVQRGSEHPS